jgi:hypothetical protein
MRYVLPVLCGVLVAQSALGEKRRAAFRPNPSAALVLKIAGARNLPARVSPAHRARLQRVVALLRGKKEEAARAEFERFARGYLNARNKADIDVLVNWVMFQTWLAEDRELRETLEQMHEMNEAKQAMRDQIQMLRKAKASPAGKPLRWRTLTLRRGKATTASPGPWKTGSRQELEAAINRWEKELDSMGGISEEMSLKLQMLTDRRQKVIRTLSNIMKKLSGTANTIVQNLK